MTDQANINRDALVDHCIEVLNGREDIGTVTTPGGGVMLGTCSVIELAHDLKQVVAEELARLIDCAFPDGEESDYHYGCEALLEHVQHRIEQLRPVGEGA